MWAPSSSLDSLRQIKPASPPPLPPPYHSYLPLSLLLPHHNKNDQTINADVADAAAAVATAAADVHLRTY